VGRHGLQLDERRLGARMVDPPLNDYCRRIVYRWSVYANAVAPAL
jgi:hypothetical protein